MLTAAKAAALLGISQRAVYDLAASRKITCYRFGGATRFERVDVDAYKATLPKAPGLLPARVLRMCEKLRLRAVQAGAEDIPLLSQQQLLIAQRRIRNKRLPPWADRKAIAAIYAEARRLTDSTGIEHHVDHVIPLMGEFVSGLHVETNLAILPARDNISKGNRWEAP